MGKKEFAEDLKKIMDAEDYSLQYVADMFGISPRAVGKWTDPDGGWPEKSKWVTIKERLGLDIKHYKRMGLAITVQGSPHAITATNGSNVDSTVIGGAHGKYVVELDEFEYNIWVKFRDYGNRSIAERCMKQLCAIEAMSV